MLWLLVIALPLLAWFLAWSWRRKQHLIRQFVQSRLLAQLTVGVSSNYQKARLILAAVVVGALIISLARPQSDFILEKTHQAGLDIIIAIDTSRSMLANDTAPNRLSRTKHAVLNLLRQAEDHRAGLVAFAGTASLQCPLTHDDSVLQQSVNALEIGIIPQGGTALKEAIDAATQAFTTQTENRKAVILFTDGEDHEQRAVQAARAAAASDVRVFTIGVGTETGELLRQPDTDGNLTYVKDAQGNVVKSRLNKVLLTEIASVGSGFYLSLNTPDVIDILYQRGLAPLLKSPSSSKRFKLNKEHYQWPVALAIALLVLEMFLPDRKGDHRKKTANIPSISAGFTRGIIALMIFILAPPANASSRAALKSYREGRYEEAIDEYEALLAHNPNDLRLYYNAGTAAYRASRFAEAIRHFATSLTAQDLRLQQLSYYNLGNSFYRFGETLNNLEEKQAAWEQSIKHYGSALKLDPQDEDAEFNRTVVRRKLESLHRQKRLTQNVKPTNGTNPGKSESEEQKIPQSKKANKDKNRASDHNKAQSETKKVTAEESETSRAGMSLDQAIRLLDAQKSEETVINFNGPERNSLPRPVSKDW